MIEQQLLLATISAWANRHQESVIACLVEKNRVLREQLELGVSGSVSPRISAAAWPRSADRSVRKVESRIARNRTRCDDRGARWRVVRVLEALVGLHGRRAA